MKVYCKDCQHCRKLAKSINTYCRKNVWPSGAFSYVEILHLPIQVDCNFFLPFSDDDLLPVVARPLDLPDQSVLNDVEDTLHKTVYGEKEKEPVCPQPGPEEQEHT